MATFFVGQRVRMARPRFPENLGIEGRILEIGLFRAGEVTAYGRIPVNGDKCDCIVGWDDGGPGVDWLHKLEPILPSGHQPCDAEFKRDLDRLLEGVAA